MTKNSIVLFWGCVLVLSAVPIAFAVVPVPSEETNQSSSLQRIQAATDALEQDERRMVEVLSDLKKDEEALNQALEEDHERSLK